MVLRTIQKHLGVNSDFGVGAKLFLRRARLDNKIDFLPFWPDSSPVEATPEGDKMAEKHQNTKI